MLYNVPFLSLYYVLGRCTVILEAQIDVSVASRVSVTTFASVASDSFTVPVVACLSHHSAFIFPFSCVCVCEILFIGNLLSSFPHCTPSANFKKEDTERSYVKEKGKICSVYSCNTWSQKVCTQLVCREEAEWGLWWSQLAMFLSARLPVTITSTTLIEVSLSYTLTHTQQK